MEPERFDVEISISHAVELRKTNRKKFDRLMDRLHSGLLDFPGVGCVVGPETESTEDERQEWDRIDREWKARQSEEIRAAVKSVLAEPEFREKIKGRISQIVSQEVSEETAMAAQS
jgi:hypothetical protein